MKILHTTLVIAATTTALTSMTTTTQADTKNFRSGVYAGAELGWLHEDHKYHQTANVFAPYTPSTIVSSKSRDSDAFLPGLFLGYRYFLNGSMRCWFAGLELGAQINSSKTNANFNVNNITPGTVPIVTTINTKHHLKGKYNITPSLTFGRHFMDKYALYGKIGYDFGQYDYKVTESVAGVLENSKKSHIDFNRVFLGIGGEYAINCRWSARAEYVYTFSNDKEKVKMVAANTGINDYNTRLKVSSSALKFGLFAKF